jgi:hypothetical protein
MTMKEANRDVFDGGSLPELLAHRARQASDRRLAVDVALGLIVAAAVAILRPPLWLPFTALGICLVAFGAWGILDREVIEAGEGGRRAMSVGRNIVALVGGAAAVLFGVSLFFSLLGSWIS